MLNSDGETATMNNEKMIEARDSSIHSMGVFAKKTLRKDGKIIEYIGNKIPKKVTDDWDQDTKDPVYLFELNDEYDIDGDVSWNVARYINHSCDPNCESFYEDGKIWICAIKDIEEGEELTFDYNLDIEPSDYKQYVCLCKSPKCRGYYIKEEIIPIE